MKPIKIILGTIGVVAVLGIVAIAMAVLNTGCVHTPVVVDGVTNIVTTIDQVKLDKVKVAVEPVAASVLRRAIHNSPQHAAEIGNYARAVGSAVCTAVSQQSFTPGSIAGAVDKATQGLQMANIPAEVIDAKNGLIALYTILFDDQLTVQLPNNQWPSAVLGIFCDSIDLALKDSGQAGVK